MPGRLELQFTRFGAPAKGVLVLFCEEVLKFGSVARRAMGPAEELVRRAATADRFKGKNGSALDLVAPSGLDVQISAPVPVSPGWPLAMTSLPQARSQVPDAACAEAVIATRDYAPDD